ncbi:MAG TPA: DUF86 domain-containing protein [Syntrophobacteraceae bacterium]|jgi:uncharacterized protein YutE (UPF0331/DUF86 family)|nr:DUF86 domain-containing protein [Syntrophobacteraceae bacterium]HBD08092.1 DUF86 domain-containing protein [Syntrophobacteraceae bacterium]
MSPEVVVRKLARMSQYLQELRPYRESPYEAFWADHYKIERLIELLVVAASDIVIHLLDSRGEPAPASYRSAFLQAGETKLLSGELSRNLALGAGLRNILVHEYEEIDYQLLHRSLPKMLDDMAQFIDECLPYGV